MYRVLLKSIVESGKECKDKVLRQKAYLFLRSLALGIRSGKRVALLGPLLSGCLRPWSCFVSRRL